MFDFITMVDGYKVDHRRQYPVGTEYVYSNFTPRSTRVPGQDTVVFFGLQYFLAKYLQEIANETFFDRQRAYVVRKYQKFLDGYLGPNQIGTEHIADLHDLGYITLRFNALPEGTSTPLKVPMFTVENTKPEFFWVTNYIETMLSNQYVTRDTYGFAMKATWAQVNGEEHMLFKDPITDDGGKRSARGRLAVYDDFLNGRGLRLQDGLRKGSDQTVGNLLQTVWQNGRFVKQHTLAEIRARVQS